MEGAHMSDGRNRVAELEALLDGKNAEIERLRAALTLIRDGYYNEMSAATAGAALEGKE
jgi:hypothetical protein